VIDLDKAKQLREAVRQNAIDRRIKEKNITGKMKFRIM
jgi:hypothetical protein